MNDKEDLLWETQEIIYTDESMGWPFLRKVFFTIALILLIVFPKIFINTQIYFKSRKISTLTQEHDALVEENRLIGAKVEHLIYKNKILDPIS